MLKDVRSKEKESGNPFKDLDLYKLRRIAENFDVPIEINGKPVSARVLRLMLLYNDTFIAYSREVREDEIYSLSILGGRFYITSKIAIWKYGVLEDLVGYYVSDVFPEYNIICLTKVIDEDCIGMDSIFFRDKDIYVDLETGTMLFGEPFREVQCDKCTPEETAKIHRMFLFQ